MIYNYNWNKQNTIISTLLNNNSRQALKQFKQNLKVLIQNESKTWTYNNFQKLYSTIRFVLENDVYINSIIQKRKVQLESYDYEFTGSEKLEEFIQRNKDLIYQIWYNKLFFGKCLVRFIPNSIFFNLEIIEPERYYVSSGDIIFLDDSEQHLANQYLYFGKEYIDTSIVSISLVSYSIDKETIWKYQMENLEMMNGFLQAKLGSSTIQTASEQGLDYNDLSCELSSNIIKATTEGGVTVTDNETLIERISGGQSNSDYTNSIQYLNQLIEVAILGQSGTTTETNAGSYAKAKIMDQATKDIGYVDIHSFEDIVNSILYKLKDDLKIWEQHSFNIKIAIDSDELNYLNIIEKLNNLNLQVTSEPNQNSISIPLSNLKENLNLPIQNQGFIVLGTKPKGSVDLEFNPLGGING